MTYTLPPIPPFFSPPLTLIAVPCSVRQQGYPGSDPESDRGIRGFYGDGGQLLRGGVGVDGAVSVHQHLVGEAHEEDGGDDGGGGERSDELQCGAHGVGRRVHGAGHHAARITTRCGERDGSCRQ